MLENIFKRKVVCMGLAIVLSLVLLAGIASNAKACYWYQISCEGKSYQDYDGGGEDVEHHSITCDAVSITAGDKHDYNIKFEYSPGCGSRYSGKWIIVQQESLPSGWTAKITDTSGADIYGKDYSWSGSGEFNCVLTVTSPSSAPDGQAAKVSAHLWSNDTAACNEHNTLDVFTVTQIGGGSSGLKINVVAPNGGEVWTVGTTHDVKWLASGGTGTITVDLSYSTTGLTGTYTAISAGEANDGTYTWTIPNTPSENCFVKAVAKDSATTAEDTSDVKFSIVSSVPMPTITLITPDGGEIWTIATQHDITWTASGGTGTLTIGLELSTAGSGGPWTTISAGETNDGIYTWTIPNSPSTNCYVKATVTDSNTPPQTASDLSNSAFEIAIATTPPPAITVQTPNGGELWTALTTHDITWSANGGTGTLTVKLELSITGAAGPWTTITTSETNDGTYTWTVPNSPSTDCYVQATVTDSATPPQSGVDKNNNPFTILAPSVAPVIILNTPMGGEKWTVGTQHDITWSAGGGTGTLKVMLEYSTTGSTGAMTTIANNEPNDGVFTWTIPNTPSTNCYILATVTDSATSPQTGDNMNPAAFTITTQSMPTVKLTCPNGGELWSVNSKKNITWIASGGTGTLKVMLEYSTTGSTGPWTIIVQDEPNDGTYLWTVPNIPSTDCYIIVMVTDQATPVERAFDVGDTSFTITIINMPSITLVVPNGGESWEACTQHDITWIASGGTGKIYVGLRYSTHGVKGPWVLVTNNEDNDGTYTWNIPNTPSINCYMLVTVTDSGSPPQTVSDIGNGPFTITSATKGMINGVVKDGNGIPVKDAIVVVTQGGVAKATIKTINDGSYSIAIIAGDYKINASKAGYSPSTTYPITVEAGDTVSQDLVICTLTPPDDTTKPKTDTTPLLYGLGIGVVAILLIPILLALLRRKRKKGDQEQKWLHYGS